MNFKNRFKNVELKLDERLLFDLKLKEYETIYPLPIDGINFTLYLRKKPVGGFECELLDEEKNHLPCLTDRPKNFGRPKKHWNKVVPLIGYLIALSWVLFILIMTIRLFIQQ